MPKYFTFLPIIFMSHLSNATISKDTISGENGSYSIGKINQKGKIGWWKFYDSNGLIQKEVFFKYSNIELGRYQTKGYEIRYKYSSDNKLKAKGKWYGYTGKQGKWMVYDSIENLVKIENYRYGRLHGLVKDFTAREETYFYFGLKKSELYNSKGQRYVFYFTSGGGPKFKNEDNCNEEDKFACINLRIAQCVINSRIERIIYIHNIFVNIRQAFRFGFDWEQKFFDECN